MPTYEYLCQDCGKTVEFFQSIKEPPQTECPTCKGELKRLVSKGGGIIFKGAGFYENDYKKKEPPKPATHHHAHNSGEHKENGNGSLNTSPEKSDNTETVTETKEVVSKETTEKTSTHEGQQ
jgi:putative FmdB family regulatory protein